MRYCRSASREPSGLFTRYPHVRFRYQTYEFGDSDLHVRTLRDRQEFDDPEGHADLLGITSTNWSLFGVVWDSGEVLARLMWDRAFHGERILEVGCGIGLASLALAMRDQDISATDGHPEAQKFLSFNAELNQLPHIPFVRCGWDEPGAVLGEFDLIIGSDLLYEHWSLKSLSRFVEHHASETCEVVIVDPNRGLRGAFARHMERAGFRPRPHARADDYARDGYTGSILGYERALESGGAG